MMRFVLGMLTGFGIFVFWIAFGESIADDFRNKYHRIAQRFQSKKVLPFATPFNNQWVIENSIYNNKVLMITFTENNGHTFYGKLQEGPSKEGIWSYTEFELQGINSQNYPLVNIGDDLLELVLQLDVLKQTFSDHDIKVKYVTSVEKFLKEIDQLSNLHILKRRSKDVS